MMNQRLGQIHFWLTLIFFNLTFFTMHFLGFAGHMRRIAEPMNYPFLESTQGLHTFITISALILGASQLIFAFNFIRSIFRGKEAPANPWDANTLEWSVKNPGHGNWGLSVPIVYHGRTYEEGKKIKPRHILGIIGMIIREKIFPSKN